MRGTWVWVGFSAAFESSLISFMVSLDSALLACFYFDRCLNTSIPSEAR